MDKVILSASRMRIFPFGPLGFVVITAALIAGILLSLSPRRGLLTPHAAHSAAIASRPLALLPAALIPAVARTLAARSPHSWRARITPEHSAVFTNPTQHLTVSLDQHGALLKLDGTPHDTLVMQLLAYRRDADVHAVSTGPLSVQGNRVERSWGRGVTEWYVNSPLGLEQGFMFEAPAAAPASLALVFKLGGSLRPMLTGDTLVFRDKAGRRALRYDRLLAYDARQRELPAHLILAGDRLTLNVNTAGAVFPVSVDPLFSTFATFNNPQDQGSSNFAYSVALSADGNTALIGDVNAKIGTQSGEGAAYVYTRSGGIWSTTPHTFSDPPDLPDSFGSSVALSADGNLALIGAFNTTVSGQSGAGKVYVYTRSGGVWSGSPSYIFSAPTPASGDKFGSGVALSADGNTALIGAYGTTISGQAAAGKAYVYTFSGGSWSLTQTFSDPDGAAQDQFGLDVTLSATNASSALIGAWDAKVAGLAGAGKAYVYNQSGGVWPSTPTQTFSDPAAAASDNFGVSVALSADAGTALIGAPGTKFGGTNHAGMAYVYSQNSGVWSTTPVTFGNPTNGADAGNFGSSGALSSDGSIALIGARLGGSDSAGVAYGYSRSTGVWFAAPPVVSLADPPDQVGDGFGNGVALSADAATALVGADGTRTSDNLGVGAAYAFDSAVDLSLALSSNPGSVNKGQNLTYMLTVTNNDTQVTAGNLILTDSLPTGMGFVSASAAGGSCSNSSGTVTCTLANLAPAGAWQPSITVTANLGGSIINNASVSAQQADPDPANNSASVTTTVNIPGVTPPTASNGSVTTTVNTAASGTLSATDPQNFSLSFALVDPAGHGTAKITNPVTGAFTYTPASGYHGNDAFSFQATDSVGAVSNTATESITVNDVAPTAHNGSVTTQAGQTVGGTLAASPGYSGQTLSFVIATQPAHGTVTLTDVATGAFNYMPAAGFTGSDNFSFTAGDGTISSNTANEGITVSPSTSGGGSSGGGGGTFELFSLLCMGVLFLIRKRYSS